jgi:hypothetical protein
MSLLCPSQTSLTDSELSLSFGNGTTQIGLLPETMPDISDREGNGMLKTAKVNEILDGLKRSGIIPTPTPTNAKEFMDKQAKVITNIKAEYCFYYARYKYSLEKLLGFIRQGYNANTESIQSSIQKYLKSTQELNQKLNDLIQIINGITAHMTNTSKALASEIEQFDKEMKEQQEKLINQSKIIKSSEAATKLNKEMVKYTEQKAKYTDNLLNMYTVLNIFALGMLLYIYKSANE